MTEEKIDRTPRASGTRANKTARKPWRPPSLLDAPPAPEGFTHRWIRSEVRGFDDRKNISARMREGWELVRKEEYPDFEAPTIEGGRHEGVFGVGGLLLARIPIEIVEERKEYFDQMNSDAMDAVDNDLFKENQHHSMAIQKPERQSRVTFGGPKT
ncbi:MAG: hypothetical protein CML19_00130 [Pusillimonas sp.]|nr:hypothetical protein [Pusillimonas sp.]|tara:strand:- start:864 stop:1331 length:468 start_codon:yes stop_codon:yes gene_type:complete